MTAGKGIQHSEFNPSDEEVLKLLQIWFTPNKQSLTPSYEQKKFSHEEKQNKLLKVVSGEKEEGIIFINQDAEIFLSNLDKGKEIKYEIKKTACVSASDRRHRKCERNFSCRVMRLNYFRK